MKTNLLIVGISLLSSLTACRQTVPESRESPNPEVHGTGGGGKKGEHRGANDPPPELGHKLPEHSGPAEPTLWLQPGDLMTSTGETPIRVIVESGGAAGLVPSNGVSPIYNSFDRTGGGRFWRAAVTRSRQRDWRGGRLSYDEHDGTDFVCPPGTPVVAAAPGILVATRDRWLRGGLTACVDHGGGLVTQYTHLKRLVAELGEPVERGQTIALSGVSGFDILQFFPWVPPHLHFMVWLDGVPVDPYVLADEANRPGSWLHSNEPLAAHGALEGDRPPRSTNINRRAIDDLVAGCRDDAIRAEVEGAPSDAARAAILEYSLHHDSPLWPDPLRRTKIRLPTDPSPLKLTLPLSAELYRTAYAADTRWTRPTKAPGFNANRA